MLVTIDQYRPTQHRFAYCCTGPQRCCIMKCFIAKFKVKSQSLYNVFWKFDVFHAKVFALSI